MRRPGKVLQASRKGDGWSDLNRVTLPSKTYFLQRRSDLHPVFRSLNCASERQITEVHTLGKSIHCTSVALIQISVVDRL
jgi:hypothetical protein